MRTSSRGALALAAAVWLAPEVASAYCHTSVCPGDIDGHLCNPTQSTDCGIPLFWNPACVGVSVQRDGSSQLDVATTQALVQQAFAAWEAADCAGGRPAVSMTLLDPVSCDQQEYNQEGGNANIVLFREREWPYVGAGKTLALTTVTYNLDTGEIYDADLELNVTSQIPLTTSDTAVQYDVLSIMTHEVGHMLGMAHSPNPQATMTVEYDPGHLDLRSLDADDVAGICATYPPPDIQTCDATPRHGFADECDPVVDEGCGCRVGAAGDEARGALLLLGAAAGLVRRATRRARRT